MSRRRKTGGDPADAGPLAESAPVKKSPPRRRGGAKTKPDNAPGTSPAVPAATVATPRVPAADPLAPAPRLLLRMELPVRWRDLDAFSHVNNSTFLTYIEEARLQWFQSLPGPWLSEDAAPVLAATHVNYRRPIEWPARLVVELYTERIGNTSFTVAHRILRADDPAVLYSDGSSVLVWIDRSGRPAPLPAAVRAAASV